MKRARIDVTLRDNNAEALRQIIQYRSLLREMRRVVQRAKGKKHVSDYDNDVIQTVRDIASNAVIDAVAKRGRR